MKKIDRAALHHAEANILETVAEGKPVTEVEQTVLHKAAAAARRAAKLAESPVLELGAQATAREVDAGRRHRAVRRGKDVFLPTWRQLTTAMPNLLLRSALWSVRSIGHRCEYPIESDIDFAAVQQEHSFSNQFSESKQPRASDISTLGDVTLINRGPALGAYDRKVFATCLDYYRDDRPLSPGGAFAWVEVSFFKFLESMNVGYNEDSHKSVRISLERLSALSLHVRHGGREHHLPRILDISFADGEARGDASCGSDLIAFRVLEPFAELYGPAKWTAVPHVALDAGKGIKSWVAAFYATHDESYPTKLSVLHGISGTSTTQSRFNSDLKAALTALKSSDVPKEVRVEEFEFTKTHLTVHLVRWAKKKRL